MRETKGHRRGREATKQGNMQHSNDPSKTLIISPLHHYYHREQGLETVRMESKKEKNSYLGRKALPALERVQNLVIKKQQIWASFVMVVVFDFRLLADLSSC